MGIIKMNKRIIDVFNSQLITEFTTLMDEVILLPKEKLESLFKSKWYIWNIIRNKDFYKLMSIWVVSLTKYDDVTFLILRLVLETSNNDLTRKTFVKSIIKKKAILTVDTIKYIDNMDFILNQENIDDIICDTYVNPMILRVKELEDRLNNLMIFQ